MPAIDKPATVYDVTQSRMLSQVVLVMDEQDLRRRMLADVVESIAPDIEVRLFSDAADALAHVRDAAPDLVLVNYRLSGWDGLAVLRHLRNIHPGQALPVIVTADAADRTVLNQAFEAGASDFLVCPFEPIECRARCKNLLAMRQQYHLNNHHARALEERIEQVSRDLRLREMDTLFRLAGAADRRDAATGAHLKRMAKYSALIARGVGLPEDQVEAIELAAPMHDIGKIGIPDAIMQKSQPLDAKEARIMRTHARIGYDILKDSPSRFLQAAAVIALNHHEKFDGTGYPGGLRGREIPLKARIVALADVFDALTSERPYKAAWEWQKAVDYVVAQKGGHFDPGLVEVFLGTLDDARLIQKSFVDSVHY